MAISDNEEKAFFQDFEAGSDSTPTANGDKQNEKNKKIFIFNTCYNAGIFYYNTCWQYFVKVACKHSKRKIGFLY